MKWYNEFVLNSIFLYHSIFNKNFRYNQLRIIYRS